MKKTPAEPRTALDDEGNNPARSAGGEGGRWQKRKAGVQGNEPKVKMKERNIAKTQKLVCAELTKAATNITAGLVGALWDHDFQTTTGLRRGFIRLSGIHPQRQR